MHESFCRRARFCNPGYLIVAMKRIGRILLYFALCALAVSCANYEYDGPEAFNDKMEGLFIHYDSQAPYATAIVTVKKGSDGNSYLWLSEEHKLIPREQIPFTGQYRAMAGISESGIPDNNGFRRVTVDWLEPLDEGEVRTGADGCADDGLDILLDSWITGLEDAYLTIHYNTWWGEHPVHHDFYLVPGEDPYSLELRHDAHGDEKFAMGEGIICFDLNSLPDTGDETRQISLRWKDVNGNVETASFGFKTRK